jgi:hypothetical protein
MRVGSEVDVKATDGAMSPQRRYPRYDVNLRSFIVLGDRSYEGSIENVCEEGLAYSMETAAPALTEFPPEKKIQVIVSDSSGEKWRLECEIIWSSVSSPWPLPQDYRTLGMGVRVIDPPDNYREYVRTLQ